MTDHVRLPDSESVAMTMPKSWGLVFRHYDHPDRRSLARKTAALCRARGVLCLVAGDWRLADAVGADGVHLPEALLHIGTLAPLKLWSRRGKFVTAAAHGPSGLRRAAALNLDAALLSPVAATASHPDRRPLGVLKFSALVRARTLPVYALGGMTFAHGRTVAALGGAGIAGIGLSETYV